MSSAFATYSLCPSRPLAALVLEACRLPARRIEYRTCAEGMESVHIVEISRGPGTSMFDALIQLMSIELHWLEGWDPAQTNAGNAGDIVRHWIVPALACCRFCESPVDHVRTEMAARIKSTKPFVQPNSRRPEAGIYIDHVRVSGDVPSPLISTPIVTGALLRSEWDDLYVLYATDHRVGRLTWETGA
jgi:hypothetical protein